jgi:GTP-binding protein
MEYYVPTRGLLGFRSQLMRSTGGMGQIHSIFYAYEPVVGDIPGRRFGSLVAMEAGVATAYALVSLQQRGTFFINPGTEVYEGMVIGENIRPEDMPMNIIKAKHLDNFRAKPTEVVSGLSPARRMSLDDFIEFMEEDELLEVTPQNLRIRKRILNTDVRMREDKRRSQLVSQ